MRYRVAPAMKKTAKGFGSSENTLLVSERSGSSMSMPGMMDTILNLDLNEELLKGPIRRTKSERFACDVYCLRTRNGNMNARVIVQTSVAMANSGLISKEKALLRRALDTRASGGAATGSPLRRQVPQGLLVLV